MIFVLLESQLPKVFVLDGEGLRGFHDKPLYFSDAAYQLLPDAAFNGDYFHLQFHFLLISGAKVRQWKNFDWQVVNKLSITFLFCAKDADFKCLSVPVDGCKWRFCCNPATFAAVLNQSIEKYGYSSIGKECI